ncbi:hypothetical protein GOP47_0004774 [Adiantum capillus-veneris]|uniref:Post-GPI attachment to proteins factor 3 n=1 Tax=Adiantum capillus-veneris TaxID=13818 RepID=A0A9D4V4F5_ADICA|nr:hypothetical protein GOP47_0004774 [Adiantum capillus-veneris]
MCLWALLLCVSLLAASSEGSVGDRDEKFRTCTKQCQNTGCINFTCFESCKSSLTNDGGQNSTQQFRVLPLFPGWQMWDCTAECKYQCMVQRELERRVEGQLPVQYHGKWPFKRLLSLQEPASVVFSIANLVMHLEGLLSFLSLVLNKLPQRCQGKRSPYYEYSTLWIIYSLLAINSWFWSAIFHARDIVLTERMDYLSAVSVIGYTLIVAILRTMNDKAEATRVMVVSPIIAFLATHMLYLTLMKFDYGLNMKICLIMGVLQLLIWTVWGWFVHHPARFKLWFVVLGGAAAMLLEIFDFPPLWGLFDAHSLWHAVTVPLTYFWWGFIKDDAVFRTNYLTNAVKVNKGRKKVR